MAEIRKNGMPTTKTVGAIGDIYVDLNTGARYACTFAYKDSTGYTTTKWLKQDLVELGEDVKEEPKVEEKLAAAVEEVTEEAPVEDAPVVTEEETPAEAPKYTNYNKQYKKR